MQPVASVYFHVVRVAPSAVTWTNPNWAQFVYVASDMDCMPLAEVANLHGVVTGTSVKNVATGRISWVYAAIPGDMLPLNDEARAWLAERAIGAL